MNGAQDLYLYFFAFWEFIIIFFYHYYCCNRRSSLPLLRVVSDIRVISLLSFSFPRISIFLLLFFRITTLLLQECCNRVPNHETLPISTPPPTPSSSCGCSRYRPVVRQARGSQVAAGKVFLESSKKRPSYLPLLVSISYFTFRVIPLPPLAHPP